MSNLALPTLNPNSNQLVTAMGGTGIDMFNPQRLGGLAERLCFEAETYKARVKQLHASILAHGVDYQEIISADQDVFLVSEETALKRVDGRFWLKLYDESGLGNFMDTESYYEHKKTLERTDSIPSFTIENVVNQIEMFVGEVSKIFTKRVITIFEKLSGEHVTNSAFGFRNRMIIDNCSRYYDVNKKSRYVHDLRCVLAVIRGETSMPSTSMTTSLLHRCFNYTSEWHMADGNTMRVKGFKKGTIHIEITSEIADILNAVIADEYPNCLPESGKKKALFKSTLKPIDTMIDNNVRDVFRCIKFEHPKKKSEDGRRVEADKSELEMQLYHYKPENEVALTEAVNLLTELYGEPTDHKENYRWRFTDINPSGVIDHIITIGTMPEEVSHQFYESTQRIQDLVSELLLISKHDEICEPSAGRGALAKLLPKEQTTCFEINSFNCSVLRGLGYNTKHECFLEYANKAASEFDLVVMNPPYVNDTYWKHLMAAMRLLKSGGRIIAVVPSSVMSKKDALPSDITMKVNHEIKEQFTGTSLLNISIVTFTKSVVI